MKKIVLGLLCFLLLGCSSQSDNPTTTSPIITTTTAPVSEKGEMIYRLGDEVIKMLNDKETFVVYVGSTTCSSCIEYKPIVEEVCKENPVKIYYVLLDESGLSGTLLASQLSLEYTPTTYYIEEGTVVESIVGKMDKADLLSFLKRNDYLKD